MKQQLIDICIDAVTGGTRPIRIFIFGGTFMALLLWLGIANYFDINTDIGRDIDLPNAILMAVSILLGFGSAFAIIHFADKLKQARKYRQ